MQERPGKAMGIGAPPRAGVPQREGEPAPETPDFPLQLLGLWVTKRKVISRGWGWSPSRRAGAGPGSRETIPFSQLLCLEPAWLYHLLTLWGTSGFTGTPTGHLCNSDCILDDVGGGGGQGRPPFLGSNPQPRFLGGVGKKLGVTGWGNWPLLWHSL